MSSNAGYPYTCLGAHLLIFWAGRALFACACKAPAASVPAPPRSLALQAQQLQAELADARQGEKVLEAKLGRLESHVQRGPDSSTSSRRSTEAGSLRQRSFTVGQQNESIGLLEAENELLQAQVAAAQVVASRRRQVGSGPWSLWCTTSAQTAWVAVLPDTYEIEQRRALQSL